MLCVFLYVYTYISVTDGDDSEEITVSHPQCDPDSARQGSTSDKDHDTPSENVCKKQDEVDGADGQIKENTNSGYSTYCT